MKDDLAKLSRMIGSAVLRVQLRILFFGAEQLGSLSSCSITLSNKSYWRFSCSGDGSIRVRRVDEDLKDPPHFRGSNRLIDSVSGLLSGVERHRNLLEMQIGASNLVLENIDDELFVTIDGKPPDAHVVQRSLADS